MTIKTKTKKTAPVLPVVQTRRVFQRFSLSQRWEHWLLLFSFTMLLLTGLPQKYFESWGHFLLTTPDRLEALRSVHHVFAILLILEAFYHLVKGIYLLVNRSLSAEIFPTWQDIKDAGQMVKYLLFLSNKKPEFGKYNFEQKFTYWLLFFAIALMIGTGFVVWFPLAWTRVFPGGTVPAALRAHGDEAIATALFLLIWHSYHVHFERLNLSMFTGWLTEREMRRWHGGEYQRLTGKKPDQPGEEA